MQEGETIMNNKLYFIDFDYPAQFQGIGKFVATSKARYDVTKILGSIEGIERRLVTRTNANKILGPIEVLYKINRTLSKIPKGSKVIIQYPFVNNKVFKYIAPKFKRYHSIALIHDLPSYRFSDKGTVKDEIMILNCFKTIIAHSDNMKQVLEKDGAKSKILVLGAFDYLLDNTQQVISESNTVVFAGALKKSLYLGYLNRIPMSHISFNLYGKGLLEGVESHNVKYKGFFSPDDITTISGEWGLLWEGDTIETCSGYFGEYLKIIAPHKLSLYIACGLKVIVWENSAMAPLVIDNAIGFTIASLYEIEKKITSLSLDEKNKMDVNVKMLSRKVRTGGFLKEIMNKVSE